MDDFPPPRKKLGRKRRRKKSYPYCPVHAFTNTGAANTRIRKVINAR